MTDRVGFIGVGAMGSAIASRLVDTCTLYINDRNPAAGEKLVQQGAVFATAQEIVETCGVIVLSLPGPTNVSQLLLGEDGIAAQLPLGTVIVDTTTSTPVLDQEILDALSGRGVGFDCLRPQRECRRNKQCSVWLSRECLWNLERRDRRSRYCQ